MGQKNRWCACVGLFAVMTLCWACHWMDGSKAEWAQWRGPNRDGVSLETGMLKTWREREPKVLWRVPIGEGFSGISISGGRAYTMAAEGDDEFVVCLDASSGKELWRFRSGSKFTEKRGNGPRSMPSVDDGQIFALGAEGKLYALDAVNGEKRWDHDFVKEFGSKIPSWGFSSSPLVEGNLLLVEVGGEAGKSIAAFDKKSGRVVWTSHTDKPAYSSPISITFNGIRKSVFLTAKTLLSVSPTDGRIYWTYAWPKGINIATPIFIPEDKIFISASYDKGAVLLKMKAEEGGVMVEEVWKSRVMKNHFNSSVL